MWDIKEAEAGVGKYQMVKGSGMAKQGTLWVWPQAMPESSSKHTGTETRPLVCARGEGCVCVVVGVHWHGQSLQCDKWCGHKSTLERQVETKSL